MMAGSLWMASALLALPLLAIVLLQFRHTRLRLAHQPRQVRLQGLTLGRRLLGLPLLDEAPLYETAVQRCRAPTAGESIPQLKIVANWHGSSMRGLKDLTLVTQLNLDRLDRLETQCLTWPHNLAAAVYVPLVRGRVVSHDSPTYNGTSPAEVQRLLSKFHVRMQREGACGLRLALYTEDCTADPVMAGLYPFNAMRNRALQLVPAESKAVLQLDVDFIVSEEFARGLSSKGWEAVERELERTPAVVLPCFSANHTWLQSKGGQEWLEQGRQLSLEAAAGGKSYVAERFLSTERPITQSVPHFPRSQNSTRYDVWLTANDFYNVQFAELYEPYTIMLRQHVPWFDERFRGWGGDKASAYMVMAHWGVSLAVHPTAYVVHVPHPVAGTKKMTEQLNKRGQFMDIFYSMRQELLAQQFYPVTSFASSCQLRPMPQQ